MSNDNRLYQAFASGLHIDIARVNEELAYQRIGEWDSVGHMALVAELESAFDVMLDTDDILALNSVARAREILAKYSVAC